MNDDDKAFLLNRFQLAEHEVESFRDRFMSALGIKGGGSKGQDKATEALSDRLYKVEDRVTALETAATDAAKKGEG